MSIGKTKKKRAKKTKKLYFGPEVELAIIRYNNTEDPATRSLIYNTEIKAAFEKLAENIIHTFKFYYTDGQDFKAVQHDVVTFLIEKLDRFTEGKGKAFSYFSIIAKNYLILHNNKNFKKLVDTTEVSNVENDIVVVEGVSLESFFNHYIDYWDDNLDKQFSKPYEREVAAAIVELFRRRENIEIFNKKALYVYIREMSNASTQQITRVIKLMKDKHIKLMSAFVEYDYIPKNKTY